MSKFKTVTKTIDHSTGEVVESTQVYKGKVQQRKYVALFYENYDLLASLTSMVDVKIIGYMITRVAYDSNRVDLSPSIRKEICAQYNMRKEVLSRSLTSLKKAQILSGGPDIFYVTDKLFWKGSLSKLVDLMKTDK